MSGRVPVLRRVGAAVTGRTERLSLRTRLVAVLVVLLLVTSAVVAFVSLLLLHDFLQTRLDQQLQQAGQRFAISLEHPSDRDPDDALFASVIGQPAGTLGARVAGGVVTAAGVVGRSARVSEDARAVLARLPASARPRTVNLLDGLGEYRVLVSNGRDGDLLITGLPEHSVDETIGHLAAIEATVFGIAVVLAALAGAASVRWSLRPLRRVARTALRVSALPLSSGAVSMPERVPPSPPNTEVGQVAEAFNAMLEHVEYSLGERHATADRLRQFAADASHELRTPVAVIGSHAEYVLRTSPQLTGEARDAVQRIHAESERMGRLVEELLTLARLDAHPRLEPADVDLTRLALDAVGDLRRTAADHRWQLDLPPDPVVVRGDPHGLHQALANLLANARTHTPAGTTVTVSVTPQGSDGTVAIAVIDDGPGIAPEVLPHVFERFRRGDHLQSPDSANAGLGLAIVEAIAQAHGGVVTVTSHPGRTEFRLIVPVEDTGEEDASA